MVSMAEYIWIDGAKPTQHVRSKTKVVHIQDHEDVSPDDFPDWGFDGSSTYQAEGKNSDLVLVPVSVVHDPVRGSGNYLVMCEVMNPDGSPHSTNTRAQLREVLDQGAAKKEAWFGFEQEYTLMRGHTPLGWPKDGFPAPQGPFYCGVGADEVYGRQIVEEHLQLCIDAGLMIYGVNAEVMPGQWEYQIGYRGIGEESADALTISDHNWITRWLLYRVGEEFKVAATLDPKPVKGDWNGAGLHTNFSTKELRDPKTGLDAMNLYLERLEARHDEHIKICGAGLDERLTGNHETCHIGKFSAGPSDRGASIRIPMAMQNDGCGYLEDRRPGANADPYVISASILKTICDL